MKTHYCTGKIIHENGLITTCQNREKCNLYLNHITIMRSTPKGVQVKLPDGYQYNHKPSINCGFFE